MIKFLNDVDVNLKVYWRLSKTHIFQEHYLISGMKTNSTNHNQQKANIVGNEKNKRSRIAKKKKKGSFSIYSYHSSKIPSYHGLFVLFVKILFLPFSMIDFPLVDNITVKD